MSLTQKKVFFWLPSPRIRLDLHDKFLCWKRSTDEFKGSPSSQMEDETIWESISVHRTSCKIVNSWRDISKLLQNSVDPLDLPPLLGHLSIGKIESKQRMLRPVEPQKTSEYEVMGHKDGSYILTRNWENPMPLILISLGVQSHCLVVLAL